MRRHGKHPEAASTIVGATASRDGAGLWATWQVSKAERLRLTPGPAARTDGLWRHTCFELFVTGAGPDYREFNFAPSGAWAAYGFDSYRAGMRDLDAAPAIEWRDGALSVALTIDVPGDWRVNLTAVIEEVDGTKSYWALAHPDGPPDFHDPACFVLSLPASPQT